MATQLSQFMMLEAASVNQAIQQPGVIEYMVKRHIPSQYRLLSEDDEVMKTEQLSNYPNLGKGALGDLIEFSAGLEQSLINVLHKRGDELVGVYYEGKRAAFGTLHAIVERLRQKAKLPEKQIETACYETNIDDLRSSAKLKLIESTLKHLETQLTDQPTRTPVLTPA